ncbi:MAG: phospholipase [Tannerellaceae bacterium]|jgi:hypothetical protein|nr:phospholipase [Tannerellaceae bacterium]
MWYLILSIFALGIAAAAVGYFLRGTKTETPTPAVPPPSCCGQHDVCGRERLPAAAGKQIEYYDDEELDRFRGTEPDAYSESAADEFRDVLYTLRTAEVAGWLQSLQLRRINLPDALKDEAFLIIKEQRIQA